MACYSPYCPSKRTVSREIKESHSAHMECAPVTPTRHHTGTAAKNAAKRTSQSHETSMGPAVPGTTWHFPCPLHAPVGQTSQNKALGAPASRVVAPSGHGEHAVAPAVAAKLPTGHGAHAVWKISGLHQPAKQPMAMALTVADGPAAHGDRGRVRQPTTGLC